MPLGYIGNFLVGVRKQFVHPIGFAKCIPGRVPFWLTCPLPPPEMLNILSQGIYPKPALGIYPESTNIVRENRIFRNSYLYIF